MNIFQRSRGLYPLNITRILKQATANSSDEKKDLKSSFVKDLLSRATQVKQVPIPPPLFLGESPQVKSKDVLTQMLFGGFQVVQELIYYIFVVFWRKLFYQYFFNG